MNREIKFRGYNEGWHYGHYIKQARGLINGTTPVSLGECQIVSFIVYSEAEKLYIIEVHDDSVGQYTGIKDKNGVDIYEGDVLNLNNYCIGNNNTPEGKLVFVVKWEDQIGCGCCGYGTGYDFEAHNNIEVIGNIHQNPELLNS